MTREKAIEVVGDMFNEAGDARDKIGQEALGMAIKALKLLENDDARLILCKKQFCNGHCDDCILW